MVHTRAKNNQRYIIDYGGTGETIVLLHGYLSSHHYWRRLAPQLVADGFHVVCIDLLGFGAAPKPKDSTYNYQAHLEHIHTVLQSITPKTPIILVGHSMGALLAMRYAMTFRKEVSRVVLLHPPLYDSPEQARRSLRETSILYRLLLDHPIRHAMWGSMQRLSARRMGRHTMASRERSLRNVIERAEGIEDINHVSQPTLLVLGSRDRPQYVKNVEKYLSNDQITQKVVTSGHHSLVSHPVLIHELIREFVLPNNN